MYYAVRMKDYPDLFIEQVKGPVSFLHCTIYHFGKLDTMRSFVKTLPPQVELVHVEFRPVSGSSVLD